MMKMTVSDSVVAQLIELGLDHDESPIVVKNGYRVTNLRLQQNGNASFELIEDEDHEEDSAL